MSNVTVNIQTACEINAQFDGVNLNVNVNVCPGGGIGDMLSSTYDPAGGKRQVAFADEIEPNLWEADGEETIRPKPLEGGEPVKVLMDYVLLPAEELESEPKGENYFAIFTNLWKKITWANIKATLKTYFDTLYSVKGHAHPAKSILVDEAPVPDYTAPALNNTLQDITNKVAGLQLRDQIGFVNFKFDGVSQYAYNLDYDKFQSTNLVSNWSFENYTGNKDDGSLVSFENWVNSNENALGSHQALTSVYGSVALGLQTFAGTGAGYVRQQVTVTPETEYIFTFRYKNASDTTGQRGRYSIRNITLNNDLVGITQLGATDGAYVVSTQIITVPANTTVIELRLWGSAQAGFISLFDEISFILPYDFSASFFIKRNVNSVDIDRDYIISRLWSSGTNQQRSWFCRFYGDETVNEADKGKITFGVSRFGSSSTSSALSASVIPLNQWRHIAFSYKYISSGSCRIRMYVDGVLETETLATNNPIYGIAPFTVAALYPPTTFHPSECEISKLQFMFKEITQAEVDNCNAGMKVVDADYIWWDNGIFTGVWKEDDDSDLDLISNGEIIYNF